MKPPIKKKSTELRKRKYLTEEEIGKVRKAAKQKSKHKHRNDTLILMMFRHGLRVSEAVDLQWEQINFKHKQLHVVRRKNGKPATHPLDEITLRALGQLKKDQLEKYKSKKDYPETSYLFVTDEGKRIAVRTAHHIVAQAGKRADLPFTISPHMLRHSTGFYLANEGADTRIIQDYMGHANIQNTVIYTELNANRFKDLWEKVKS